MKSPRVELDSKILLLFGLLLSPEKVRSYFFRYLLFVESAAKTAGPM